jgi:hypothetical protein
MKQLKIFFVLSVIMLVNINYTKAQNDIDSETRFDVPSDAGITEIERSNMKIVKQNAPEAPVELINRYIQAKKNGNELEKGRLGEEIQDYILNNQPEQKNLQSDFHATSSSNFDPVTNDWSSSDVQVHTGTIGAPNGSFRRIDLKQGEDGWMYMAVGRSGAQDRITIYASSNNGATWPVSLTLTFTSWKLFTLSMLVENHRYNNSYPDSVRILVYFTTAKTTSGDGAQLWVFSTDRDGSDDFNKVVGIPASGHKFEFVSTCSDGEYYGSLTYMHAVVREATNSGEQVGLRHFRSIDWGVTHTNALIETGWDDYYPSAQLNNLAGTDSIYIAVERRLSATEYEIRVIATNELPQNTFRTFYITEATSGTKYEKPCITIVQQDQTVPKKIVVTYTKNNSAKYLYTTNGGATWTTDRILTVNGLSDYTWCSSDSNTINGGYVMMCAVDTDGDSITVRRGTPSYMGAFNYKRNSFQSTGLLTPVCAIINTSGSLSGALGYAGSGPTNAYYNAEVLTGSLSKNPKTVISSEFSLSQNYPNPFNPVTNIGLRIAHFGFVSLKVFDITGKEVAVLVNNELDAGEYNVNFDASQLASGTYFYRIEAGQFTEVKKMILVK